jgi:DNA-directed RNA polymerase specialized sigma24 family protein
MGVGHESASAAREPFEQVFDEYFRAVSAYALRRATYADAEEAVAETFLVAWHRLDEVPSDAKPWLLGVARRVLATAPSPCAARTARVRQGAPTNDDTQTGGDVMKGDEALALLARENPVHDDDLPGPESVAA